MSMDYIYPPYQPPWGGQPPYQPPWGGEPPWGGQPPYQPPWGGEPPWGSQPPYQPPWGGEPPWGGQPPYQPPWGGPGGPGYYPPYSPYPERAYRQLLSQALDIFTRDESSIMQMCEKIHGIMNVSELANDQRFKNMTMHLMQMVSYGNKTAGYVASLLCCDRGPNMPPMDGYYPPMHYHDDIRTCIDEMIRNYVQPMDEHHKAVKELIETLKKDRQFAQNRDFMDLTAIFEKHDSSHQQLMNIFHQLSTMPPMHPYTPTGY